MEKSNHKKHLSLLAGDMLDNGYHCSEAVFIAVGRYYLPDMCDLSIRMTTPFAGGIGCTHAGMCGALSGGLMVIGGLHGRTAASINDERCQELSERFYAAFLDHFGWLNCQELRDNWRQKRGLGSCRKLVEESVDLLIAIIESKN